MGSANSQTRCLLSPSVGAVVILIGRTPSALLAICLAAMSMGTPVSVFISPHSRNQFGMTLVSARAACKTFGAESALEGLLLSEEAYIG